MGPWSSNQSVNSAESGFCVRLLLSEKHSVDLLAFKAVSGVVHPCHIRGECLYAKNQKVPLNDWTTARRHLLYWLVCVLQHWNLKREAPPSTNPYKPIKSYAGKGGRGKWMMSLETLQWRATNLSCGGISDATPKRENKRRTNSWKIDGKVHQRTRGNLRSPKHEGLDEASQFQHFDYEWLKEDHCNALIIWITWELSCTRLELQLIKMWSFPARVGSL